jgi:hypothetical protein
MFASYYSEAAGGRKKKNKKGCFHSPFFSGLRPATQLEVSPRTETVMVVVTSAFRSSVMG